MVGYQKSREIPLINMTARDSERGKKRGSAKMATFLTVIPLLLRRWPSSSFWLLLRGLPPFSLEHGWGGAGRLKLIPAKSLCPCPAERT